MANKYNVNTYGALNTLFCSTLQTKRNNVALNTLSSSNTDPSVFKYKDQNFKAYHNDLNKAFIQGNDSLHTTVNALSMANVSTQNEIDFDASVLDTYLSAISDNEKILNSRSVTTESGANSISKGIAVMENLIKLLQQKLGGDAIGNPAIAVSKMFEALGFSIQDPEVLKDVNAITIAFGNPNFSPTGYLEAMKRKNLEADSLLIAVTGDDNTAVKNAHISGTINAFTEALYNLSHVNPNYNAAGLKFADDVESTALKSLVDQGMIQEVNAINYRRNKSGNYMAVVTDIYAPLGGVSNTNTSIYGGTPRSQMTIVDPNATNTVTTYTNYTNYNNVANNSGSLVKGNFNINKNTLNTGYGSALTTNNNTSKGSPLDIIGKYGKSAKDTLDAVHGRNRQATNMMVNTQQTNVQPVQNQFGQTQTQFGQPAQVQTQFVQQNTGYNNPFISNQQTVQQQQLQTNTFVTNTTPVNNTNVFGGFGNAQVNNTYNNNMGGGTVMANSVFGNNNGFAQQTTTFTQPAVNNNVFGQTNNTATFGQTTTFTAVPTTPGVTFDLNFSQAANQPATGLVATNNNVATNLNANYNAYLSTIYKFPELNGLYIGGVPSVERFNANPYFDKYRVSKILGGVLLNAAFTAAAGQPARGIAAGPFYWQAPLDYNNNSVNYLADLSVIMPNEYGPALDKYIGANFKALTQVDLPANLDQVTIDNIRKAFTIWTWVLTNRLLVIETWNTESDAKKEEYLYSAITTDEVSMVMDNINGAKDIWTEAENKWVNEYSRSTDPNDRNVLALYNLPENRNNIRLSHIMPYKNQLVKNGGMR